MATSRFTPTLSLLVWGPDERPERPALNDSYFDKDQRQMLTLFSTADLKKRPKFSADYILSVDDNIKLGYYESIIVSRWFINEDLYLGLADSNVVMLEQ